MRVALINRDSFDTAPALYDADALLIDASMDTVHYLNVGAPWGHVQRVDPVPGLETFLLSKAQPRADEFRAFVASGKPAAIVLSQRIFIAGDYVSYDSWHWWASSVAEPWIYGIYPAAVASQIFTVDATQPLAAAFAAGEATTAVIRGSEVISDGVWTTVAATSGGEPVCVVLDEHPNVALVAGVPAAGTSGLLNALSGWHAATSDPLWSSPQRRAATTRRRAAAAMLAEEHRAESLAAEGDRSFLERPDVIRFVRLYQHAATASPNAAEVAARLFNLLEVAEEMLGAGKGRLHTVTAISNADERKLRRIANDRVYNARHHSLREERPTDSAEALLGIGRTVLSDVLDRLYARA